MTVSEKGLGAPPGLSIVILSERACQYMMNQRKNPVKNGYGNLQKWLPVMEANENGKIGYFSTPNVNLIRALLVSSQQILNEGMERRFIRHKRVSAAFRQAMKALNLSFVVSDDKHAAATMTAIWYPLNITNVDFSKYVEEYGVVISRGIHRKISGKYFRVGHMGISVEETRNDMLILIEAIEYALEKCGYHDFKKGVGVNTYQQALKNF